MDEPPTNPSDPSWRNNGHQLPDVPAAVKNYIATELKMAGIYRSLYLPNSRLSVTNLITFVLPPMAASATEYHVPSGHTFFRQDANHADFDNLRTVKVPPVTVLAPLMLEARQKWLDGSQSICLPGSEDLFALWALDFWSELQLVVKPAFDSWTAGIGWLSRREFVDHSREVKAVFHALSRLSWTGSIPLHNTHSLGNGIPVTSLTRFLSRDWFTSVQIDQMLDHILGDIKAAFPERDVKVMDTAKTTEILKQYRRSTDAETNDYDPNAQTKDKFVQRFGASLNDRSEVVGIFHIDDNHWVSATADATEQAIGLGDPMGGDEKTSDVCAALCWFAEKHHLSLNEVEHLLCTRQQDVWNCGLYAAGAIAHKYLPNEYPLISPELKLGDLGRVDMLRRIILGFHQRCLPSAKALPSFLTQGLTEYSRAVCHSRTPSPTTPPGLEFAMQSLSVSPKRPPRKRAKTEQSSSTVAPLMAPIFKPPKPSNKKAVSKVVAKEKKASNKPTAKAKKLMKAAAIKADELATLEAMPSDASEHDVEDINQARYVATSIYSSAKHSLLALTGSPSSHLES
ncbi:hypothetical protein C8F04DRAFT_1406226 [Mycena alexandri]|uniref:Ubiquitin-like protease family profile domain-containing protein n=1 Tax=Mycena alexandri TaxID=1745969 RepID=A0AAD6RYC2_9AGAR|nr:hypothetical protein C8F04DRAFT_1406226 [Mycena alexandri]